MGGIMLISNKPYSINKNTLIYFFTDVICGWQYVFTSPEFFQIIINSLSYCRNEKGLYVHGYIIMPNHVHTILSAQNNNLSDILRDYKRFTSQKISETLEFMGKQRMTRYFANIANMIGKGNAHKVWQTGSHPISTESNKFFHQKLNYMHENPVRKGYVDRPEYWIYSSARNYYLNDHSVMKVDILE
jgi:REP element-mobilizing transposase RayT